MAEWLTLKVSSLEVPGSNSGYVAFFALFHIFHPTMTAPRLSFSVVHKLILF